MDSASYITSLSQLCQQAMQSRREDKHIGHDPVFSRGDPVIKKIFIGGDEDEQLGTP